MDLDAVEAALTEQNPRDHPGSPLRAAGGHGLGSCASRDRAGVKVIEDACQAHGAAAGSVVSAGSATRAASASIRARTSVRWATAESSPRTTTRSPRGSARCGTTARTASRLHVESGYCSRLHGLQAAFLSEKLPHLDRWNRDEDATRRHSTTSCCVALGAIAAGARRRREPRLPSLRRSRSRPRPACAELCGARHPDRHPLRGSAPPGAGVLGPRLSARRVPGRGGGSDFDRLAADVSFLLETRRWPGWPRPLRR